MAQIGIDSVTDDRLTGYGLSLGPIHLKDRLDEPTIRKTQAIGMETIGTPSRPSSSLVEKEVQVVDDPIPPSPEEVVRAMDPEELRAFDQALESPVTLEPNYLIRIQTLIGQILAQFSRLAEKERIQKEEQKAKITTASREWGKLQEEMGDRGFKFAWVSLGLMCSQFLVPDSDQQFLKFLSEEGCKNLVGMFNSETQSRQKMVDTVSALANTEITAMMNKGSSDASAKQEFINVLEKANESLKRAAQAG